MIGHCNKITVKTLISDIEMHGINYIILNNKWNL